MGEYNEEWRRFRERYVRKLGRPRKRVQATDREAVLQMDRPGSLLSVPILVEIAAGFLTDMTWEEVEEQPPSGWWGDLEPGSPALRMERQGQKLDLEVFRFETQPFKSSFEPPPEPLARLSVVVEDYGSDRPWVIISGNGPGFLTLAKHSIYLAQHDVPIGHRIGYSKAKMPDFSGRLLALERAEFPRNVPWAVPPVPGQRGAARPIG